MRVEYPLTEDSPSFLDNLRFEKVEDKIVVGVTKGDSFYAAAIINATVLKTVVALMEDD